MTTNERFEAAVRHHIGELQFQIIGLRIAVEEKDARIAQLEAAGLKCEETPAPAPGAEPTASPP